MKKVFLAMAVVFLSAAMFIGCKGDDDSSDINLSSGTPSLRVMFNYGTMVDLPIDTVKARLKRYGCTENGENFLLTKDDVTYKIALTKLVKDPTIVGEVSIVATGRAENFTSALLYESATKMPFAKGFTMGPQESIVFKEIKYGNSELEYSTQTDWSTLSDYASDINASEYVSVNWTGAIGATQVKVGCTTSLEAKRVVENGGASFYLIATCDHCYE